MQLSFHKLKEEDSGSGGGGGGLGVPKSELHSPARSAFILPDNIDKQDRLDPNTLRSIRREYFMAFRIILAAFFCYHSSNAH